MATKIKIALFCIIIVLFFSSNANLTFSQTESATEEKIRGKVTGLPIPRYVSMKESSGYTRRGPHPDYSITWEFKEKGIPFRVIDEDGNYRRVETMNGVGGWIFYQNLLGKRTVIITQNNTNLLAQPLPQARIIATAEKWVIADLVKCSLTWCKISTSNRGSVTKFVGWVSKSSIWGVDLEEIIE